MSNCSKQIRILSLIICIPFSFKNCLLPALVLSLTPIFLNQKDIFFIITFTFFFLSYFFPLFEIGSSFIFYPFCFSKKGEGGAE